MGSKIGWCDMGDDDFDKKLINKFRLLIYDKLGIHLPNDKDYLLKAKLMKIALKIGHDKLDHFYEQIINNNENALKFLIKHITINHTFFFRENEHLKILANNIKVRMLDRPVIWCAASSTGEEVYSIIIELLENGICDFLVVASDINNDVLHKMNAGIYNVERLTHVSDLILKKYFSRIDQFHYKISKMLRDYLVIKRINLIEPISFENKFDYIFCRNVLIYFDDITKKFVVNNLLDNLKDDGFLFVGHTENLFSISDKVESVFNSVYNKK